MGDERERDEQEPQEPIMSDQDLEDLDQGESPEGEGPGGPPAEEGDQDPTAEEDAQEQFEDPGELTSFGKASGAEPPWFNRKKALLFIAAGFAAIIFLALVFGKNKSGGKGSDSPSGYAATVPSRELRRLMELSLESQPSGPDFSDPEGGADVPEDSSPMQDEFGYPAVSLNDPPRPAYTGAYPQPAGQAPPAPAAPASSERQPQPHLSALVPKVEGSLFAPSQAAQAAPAPQQASDPYAALLNGAPNPLAALLGVLPDQAGLAPPPAGLSGPAQQDPQNFYGPASSGSVAGNFLQESMLWIGTILPAVLETAINTDLPGNVVARVTQNIYDSLTRKNILIPQGTLLIAQYNSSVSYQQHRVQIAWDVLIRPDGYQVELGGMNGVDPQGMAGLKAAYHENWFEYLKAAGIVTLFSVVNSKMVEEVAKYGSSEMAAGAIASNAEFIKDIGGNFISRALNIQPTLTVENGEKINVMLNKNIFLPPFRNFQVTKKYTLP